MKKVLTLVVCVTMIFLSAPLGVAAPPAGIPTDKAAPALEKAATHASEDAQIPESVPANEAVPPVVPPEFQLNGDMVVLSKPAEVPPDHVEPPVVPVPLPGIGDIPADVRAELAVALEEAKASLTAAVESLPEESEQAKTVLNRIIASIDALLS